MTLNTLKLYFTKRWLITFIVLVLVLHPVAVLMWSALELTRNPMLTYAASFFTTSWFFIVAFFFFKKSINSWESRFLHGLVWPMLSLVVYAIHSQWSIGYPWTDVLNVRGIMWQLPNSAIIILGGYLARNRHLSKIQTKKTEVKLQDKT